MVRLVAQAAVPAELAVVRAVGQVELAAVRAVGQVGLEAVPAELAAVPAELAVAPVGPVGHRVGGHRPRPLSSRPPMNPTK